MIFYGYLLPALICAALFFLWPLRHGRLKPLDWVAMAFFTLVPVVNLLVALVFSYAVAVTAWRARR